MNKRQITITLPQLPAGPQVQRVWAFARKWLLPNPGTLALILVMALTMPTIAARQSAPNASSTAVIPYQGRLANADGSPFSGSQNMEFRLYAAPAGGTPLWTEFWTGPNAVNVSDGLFSVLLGSLNTGLAGVVQANGQAYLGVTVGTDAEMAPRVQLGSAAYAMQALTVPDGSIGTAKLADGAVTTTKLLDGSVTGAKLADNVISTAKLADGSVTTAKIGAGQIISASLANGAVMSTKIADGSVGRAKLGADIDLSRVGAVATLREDAPPISTVETQIVQRSATIEKSSSVLVMFSSRAVYAGAGEEVVFQIYRDGNLISSPIHLSFTREAHQTITYTLPDTVSSGQHTYAVSARLTSGTGTRLVHQPTLTLLVIPQ